MEKPRERRDARFTLTSSPVVALSGDAAFVVGCEREADDSVRLYLDQRSRGLFMRIDAGPAADLAECAWNGSTSAHLYITPVPPPEAVLSDAEEGAL